MAGEHWKINIQNSYKKFPPTLRKIADFILDNPDEVALAPLRVLSDRIGSPPSTFTRFAQVTGYAGFKELQLALKSDFFSRTEGVHAQVVRKRTALGGRELPNRAIEIIASKVIEIEALTRSLSALALDSAVRTLATAESMLLLHDPSGHPVARYFSHRLENLGFVVSSREFPGRHNFSRLPRRSAVVVIIMDETWIDPELKVPQYRSVRKTIHISPRETDAHRWGSVLTLPHASINRHHPWAAGFALVDLLAAEIEYFLDPEEKTQSDLDPLGW